MAESAFPSPVVESATLSGPQLEELAIVVADAVEAWVYRGGASCLTDADSACNLSAQLRVLGWLCAVAAPDHADPAPADAPSFAMLYDELARALELLDDPPVSGTRPRATPRPGFIEPAAASADDEETVVRRVRVGNRALR